MVQDGYEGVNPFGLVQECGSACSKCPGPERRIVVARHQYDGDRFIAPTYLDRGRDAIQTFKADIRKDGIRLQSVYKLDQGLAVGDNAHDVEVVPENPYEGPRDGVVVFRQE